MALGVRTVGIVAGAGNRFTAGAILGVFGGWCACALVVGVISLVGLGRIGVTTYG